MGTALSTALAQGQRRSGSRPGHRREATGDTGQLQKAPEGSGRGEKEDRDGASGCRAQPALSTKDVVGLMAKPKTCTHCRSRGW